MRKLAPFAVAIAAVLVSMATPGLPGHYVLTHYDAKDLSMQIIGGALAGGACLLIAKFL